jgi:hypothetical protein
MAVVAGSPDSLDQVMPVPMRAERLVEVLQLVGLSVFSDLLRI